MSQPTLSALPDTDDDATATTPLASQMPSPDLKQDTQDLNSPRMMLPIPTPPISKSTPFFTVSDVLGGGENPEGFDELPPEIASADVSIAPDGSFVETSSASAAMELKRRYDQLFGVSKDVRSPYAITAFTNQHGKQKFRVGRKELSAPMASAVETEQRMSQQMSPSSGAVSPPSAARSKRRSRMSVHQFIPNSLRNGSVAMAPKTSAFESAGRSPPGQTGPRKLRKTRSIPDMYSGVARGLVGNNDALAGPSTGHPMGRTHSHSVTAVDMPRLLPAMIPTSSKFPTTGDVFNEFMGWEYSAPSSPFGSSSFSMSAQSLHFPAESEPLDAGLSCPEPRPLILHPFGTGVSFDSPSRKSSTSRHLSSPPVLREMQSFESGLTARADAEPKPLHRSKAPQLTLNFDPEPEGSTLLSLPSLSPSPPPREPITESKTNSMRFADKEWALAQKRGLTPSWETSMHARYSTYVFDVLQTYRGLPLLDKLDPWSNLNENTVIKIKADDTAAPRDDPRFVIWGQTQPGQAGADADLQSLSQGSRTDLSSQKSGMSRKRSTRGKSVSINSSEAPSVPVSADLGQKVLAAATIERWIAQLTSELNYDELLNFFLTYRTYIGSVDLCQLLICRFHWALGQPSSAQDEMVRRIVRVRTFVALRYWLLTFFPVDFLPNRDLRLVFANWLNTLRRDPILDRQKDALSIVRKLKQIVKDCKEAHTRKEKASTSSRHSKQFAMSGQSLGDISDGQKFAESLRKAATNEDEDSDIELDFGLDEGALVSPPQGFPSQKDVSGGANAYLAGQAGGASSSRVPSAALAVLQQPLHLTILQHVNQNAANTTDTPFVQTPATLPVHHSTLSRVLVKTIGRLGRWKRVLNQRASLMSPIAPSADVSAFDLELSATGDLLTVRGGVEQYLKMIEPQARELKPSTHFTSGVPHLSASQPDSDDGNDVSSVDISASNDLDYSDRTRQHLRSVTELSEEVPDYVEAEPSKLEDGQSLHESFTLNHRASTLTYDSAQSLISLEANFAAEDQRSWQLDIVSIDDLDLSDMSSSEENEGPAAPPGLRKVPRRLPLRRDFEFVRRSGSVSSMGIKSHSSMASGRSSSAVSSSSVGPTLGTNIQQWQVNALVDSLSDDEEGDVEAALRRLEGEISIDDQRAKISKVDGWVRTMQGRIALKDYGDEPSRFPTSDSESDEESQEGGRADASETGSVLWSPDTTAPSSNRDRSRQASEEHLQAPLRSAEGEFTPMANQTSHTIGPSNPASPLSAPAPEDVVPIEILQSRVPSRPSTSAGSPSNPASNGFKVPSPSNKFSSSSTPQLYRSFILSYRAETLAQHFSMIDRELFLAIKFEELVSEDWMGSPQEANVLDWGQFLRDRARWKAESRGGPKTSSVVAVRGRFNLISNFVLSEVVLTHPHHRFLVVGKFIRIAWKAYCMNNFNTLTAIIAGLQSEWVAKAMRRLWGRIGMWEQRMFQDLKAFSTRDGDFRHIRHAVSAMVEAKPIAANTFDISAASATDGQSSSSKSKAASDSKPHSPTGCIPFIGVYLSQMHRYQTLPDLIDPTAPDEAIGVDPITGNFEAPAHPEVFSSLAPLPPSMQLEPLINVQKQRLIAGVIKSLVAGQHLASRVQFPTDRKTFQRCLKLRGLDSETLQQVFSMFPE